MEDQAKSHVRVAVEDSFAATSVLLGYITIKRKLKIIEDPLCTHHYFVASIIRNAWISLNVGQLAKRFKVKPPVLEDYFSGRIRL